MNSSRHITESSVESGAQWMPTQVIPRLQIWVWRHGLWLPITALLLAGAMALAYDRVLIERAATAAQRAASPPLPVLTKPARSLDDVTAERFYTVLKKEEDLSVQVRQVFAKLGPDIVWSSADFQHTEDPELGVIRVQVAVALSGEYKHLKSAIRDLLVSAPNLSLDQVAFERQSALESNVDVRARFSIWLSSRTGSQAATKEGHP